MNAYRFALGPRCRFTLFAFDRQCHAAPPKAKEFYYDKTAASPSRFFGLHDGALLRQYDDAAAFFFIDDTLTHFAVDDDAERVTYFVVLL